MRERWKTGRYVDAIRGRPEFAGPVGISLRIQDDNELLMSVSSAGSGVLRFPATCCRGIHLVAVFDPAINVSVC